MRSFCLALTVALLTSATTMATSQVPFIMKLSDVKSVKVDSRNHINIEYLLECNASFYKILREDIRHGSNVIVNVGVLVSINDSLPCMGPTIVKTVDAGAYYSGLEADIRIISK